MKFERAKTDNELVGLLPDFVEYTISDFEKLTFAYGVNDYDGMRKICHTILGSAKSYGFTQMDQIVQKVKDAVVARDDQGIKDWYIVLSKYVEFLKKEYL